MQLGQKIRQKRQEKGMSLTNLAELIERTPSFLSQIERGLAEPSITSLRMISEALEVPIFYFLLDTNEHNPVVRREKRKVLHFSGSQQTFELISPDLNRKIEMIEARLDPGIASSPEPVTHPGEECMVVIQGKMSVEIGEEVYILEPGDSIYYFAMIPHRIVSIGEEELVWIASSTPPTF